jgi:AraC family transcriptional regulator
MHSTSLERTAIPAGPGFHRDALLAQMSRILVDAADGSSEQARLLVEALVGRVRHLRNQEQVTASTASINGLPRWRLKRVSNFVQAHLDEPITLAGMATAAGLSPMYFAARFRDAMGMSPHRYLLACRIAHAKTLLAEAGRPLIDIALSVGFRTQAHFTTVFREFEGSTPHRWRQTRD